MKTLVNQATDLSTIPDEIILGAWPGPVRHCAIEPQLCGGYLEVPDGEPAITFLVRSGGPGSNLLDTCAVTEAGDVYTMNGMAWAVGLDNYDKADILREPLLLHSSPIAWLASGGQGSAVLDWFTAGPKMVSLTIIVCDSVALADKVDRHISKYGAPRPDLRVPKMKAA